MSDPQNGKSDDNGRYFLFSYVTEAGNTGNYWGAWDGFPSNDDLKAIIIDHHRFKGEPEIVITSVHEFKNLGDYNAWCGDE